MIKNDAYNRYKELSKMAVMLKVIAHPIRLQILENLGREKSMTVTDIKAAINSTIEQSMLSHHLIKMKDNGLLSSKKNGKYNHYSLVNPSILRILELEK